MTTYSCYSLAAEQSHAKPHCCGPDWLRGQSRLTPDGLVLALWEIRHKAVFLEVFLCSPCSDVQLKNNCTVPEWPDWWCFPTKHVAACKCTGGKSQDQWFIFFLSKSTEYLLDFFLNTPDLRGILQPSTNTDSICPSAIHLFLHHILPLETTLSKQHHTQIIHYVNGVIGTCMPCERPWHATGTQWGFTAETGKGTIGQQVLKSGSPQHDAVMIFLSSLNFHFFPPYIHFWSILGTILRSIRVSSSETSWWPQNSRKSLRPTKKTASLYYKNHILDINI